MCVQISQGDGERINQKAIIYKKKKSNLLKLPYRPIMLEVKAIALQAWTGPEGSRRLRIPDFKTMGT
jgi:hypothetical protein